MGLIKSTKKILRTVKVLLDVFRYGGKCYASKGIIANAYAPGIILTDMQPELKNKRIIYTLP